MPRTVLVTMGSQSDWSTMVKACDRLDSLKIPYDKEVISAHRTPDRIVEKAKSQDAYAVIIAGAGGAAHLPGMLAAHFPATPIIGVPVQSGALNGLDSLYSIVQMPAGVPVATVKIGEAENAAIIAAQILAQSDPELLLRLLEFRRKLTKNVPEFPIEALDVGAAIPGASGKTKTLYASTTDPYVAYAQAKDMVTWGNIHELHMPGKGIWATAVTCNMFELFNKKGFKTAYLGRVDERTFKTKLCRMFPYEVVVCGKVDAKSSYKKRNPNAKVGERLPYPEVDVFLKTSGKVYRQWELPCDDPLMVTTEKEVQIYLPDKPIAEQTPIFTVPRKGAEKVFPGFEYVGQMCRTAAHAFETAEEALAGEDSDLFDGKWEFGVELLPPDEHGGEQEGKLLMADVFDADSMRLLVKKKRADKQVIRNGGKEAAPEQVDAYLLAVEVTDKMLAALRA